MTKSLQNFINMYDITDFFSTLLQNPLKAVLEYPNAIVFTVLLMLIPSVVSQALQIYKTATKPVREPAQGLNQTLLDEVLIHIFFSYRSARASPQETKRKYTNRGSNLGNRSFKQMRCGSRTRIITCN